MYTQHNLTSVIRFTISPKWDVTLNLCKDQLLNKGHPKAIATAINHRQTHRESINVRQGLAQYKAASAALITQKWGEAYSFYDQFMHMDEVREAHNKVMIVQQKLEESQERRAVLMIELTAIRKEHKQLNDDLLNCNRRDPQYLKLVQRENDVGINGILLNVLNIISCLT